ncbi:flagellar protein FlgN [bacterium]|nr:flagellar protein FlgN [bacterium]
MMEMRKNGDVSHDELENIIQHLTRIIENEIKAFQSLLNILVNQKNLQGAVDPSAVSSFNQEVNQILVQTKRHEEEYCGKSKDISGYLDLEEPLTLSQLIPLIKKRYADRLEELKGMLLILSNKMKSTDRQNRHCLEQSLEFVNQSLEAIVGCDG